MGMPSGARGPLGIVGGAPRGAGLQEVHSRRKPIVSITISVPGVLHPVPPVAHLPIFPHGMDRKRSMFSSGVSRLGAAPRSPRDGDGRRRRRVRARCCARSRRCSSTRLVSSSSKKARRSATDARKCRDEAALRLFLRSVSSAASGLGVTPAGAPARGSRSMYPTGSSSSAGGGPVAEGLEAGSGEPGGPGWGRR